MYCLVYYFINKSTKAERDLGVCIGANYVLKFLSYFKSSFLHMVLFLIFTVKAEPATSSEQRPPVYQDQPDPQLSKTDSNFLGTNSE